MTNPATTNTTNVVARISGVGVEFVITTETSMLFDVVSYCGPQVRVELPDATWREAMRFVTDEIAAQIDEIVDADLVEVSPGAFLPSREAATLLALRTADKRVEKVRGDHIVGRGTCSVIDETYTDAELAAWFDGDGVTSPTVALRVARARHRVWASTFGGGF